MTDKWLHIEETCGDPWILPIWASVNSAVQKGKINDLPNEVYEMGIHISTRLNILPRIVSRINTEVTELFSIAERHEETNVFTTAEEGYALGINNDLKYNLICDIDSLLFELNSVCELMTKLFESLYSHVGKALKKEKVGLKIKSIIENANQNPSWFNALDKHRNFFTHNGSPYVSIDITRGRGNYELLIMKENLKSFEDEEKFIRMSMLNEIVQGFVNSKPIIQADIVSLFDAI